MGEAYPKVLEELEVIQSALTREEHGFDRTLRTGLTMLEQALAEAEGTARLPGEVAFRLHDTHGFPIEMTEELAGEAGLSVDRAGYDRLMEEQRTRARQAARLPVAADEAAYRAILEAEGPTTFVGRAPEFYAVPTRITGVLAGTEPGTAEIFLERSPFYAEGGGQVGDTGTIVTETGRAEVYDTVPALPGLHVHRARVSGELFAGQDALAAIDVSRREAVRRNHTGTHLLHAALRNVLGDSVRQRGSLVAPDRLRFDFSHHAAVAPEELVAVAEMANGDVLSDDEVETIEASRDEAERMGAVAFFEEKYGDLVRVVRAGPHSLEFCGGTHVNALGMIGPIAILSEGSIGANIRRIFALTGQAAVDRSLEQDQTLRQVASLLKVEPEGEVEALDRLVERQRAGERELSRLRSSLTSADAAELAAQAEGGVVAARRDGQPGKELQSLAQAIHQRDGVRGVVIGGIPEPGKVAIAVVTGGDPDAAATVKKVGALVGGGGGGSATVALAGGREAERLDEAISEARRLLTQA
jgi:alanyl-tRNA synthetase